MALRSTVYSCSFFKKINSHGFFHVPEDYQHDSLLIAVPGTFSLPKSQCISMLWTVFWLKLIKADSFLVYLYTFFDWNMLLHTHSFGKFHMVCTDQSDEIWYLETFVPPDFILLMMWSFNLPHTSICSISYHLNRANILKVLFPGNDVIKNRRRFWY